MAATINWAQLGVGIPSKFAEKHEPVNMNTDAYVKAGDQINGMFDRWNREKAADSDLEAKKQRLAELKQKLADLQAELNGAAVDNYSDNAYEQASNLDPVTKLGGYQSPSNSMIGYTPNDAVQSQAYSNAYAMMGAGRPNVRF